VVRIGHYKGQRPGGEALRKALAILMEAVPATSSQTSTR
jgi:ribulose 1,5-bisphosphate carboxylase large subunit-like protein